VVAVAAGVGNLEQVLTAERALEVAVPLDGISRAVAWIHRERRWELGNVAQSREQGIGVEAQVGPCGLQGELTVHRRHETRELKLVQVQVVVVDAKAGAHDCFVGRVVRKADARAPVVEILLQDPCGEEIVLIDDERNELRWQIRGDFVQRDFAPFIDDNWQMWRTLTLQRGLRWEYLAPWHQFNDLEASVAAGTGRSACTNLPSH